MPDHPPAPSRQVRDLRRLRTGGSLASPLRCRAPMEGQGMVTRKTVGAVVGGLGLVLSSTVMGAAVMCAPRMTGSTAVAPWAGHLTAADDAASGGDVTRALNLPITRHAGTPAAGVARARELHLSALFRARDAGSLDGALGDRDVTRHALRMAARPATRDATPTQRARLAGIADRPDTIPEL